MRTIRTHLVGAFVCDEGSGYGLWWKEAKELSEAAVLDVSLPEKVWQNLK